MRLWYWFLFRVGSRCYAQGCGRLIVLHTHRQLERCIDTPMAIELTDPGWLATVGVDPRSAPEPVVPVSRAS